jgi:hypothetical protein
MNKEKNPKGLLLLWRQGRLAERPAFATAILAAVLLLTLAGAYLFVRPHQPRYHAIENANKLLQQVRHQGLDHYLGQKPLTRFWLLENANKVIGFNAFHVVPVTNNQITVYQGQELLFLENEASWQGDFQIANDLSFFYYDQPDQVDIPVGPRTRARSRRVRISYENARLVYEYVLSSELTRPVAIPYDPELAIVPRVLIDLFTSLAANQANHHGALFAIPAPKYLNNQLDLFTQYWAYPDGDVPANVRKKCPNGHPAHARNLNQDLQQLLYYDQNHLLLWQKDLLDSPTTLRAVSSQELLQQFPQARPLVRAWENLNDSNDHHDDQPAPADRIIL